jgi:prefoldin subunit 2
MVSKETRLTFSIELQTTYQNYKNTLQTIAQKIGDIEQEAEEHK